MTRAIDPHQAAVPRSSRESFFAPVRGSMFLIVLLSLLGVVSGLVPFVAIVELGRALLPALTGGRINQASAWWAVAIAVLALFVSVGAAFASGIVSHFADARLQNTVRRRILQQLRKLPLGWFDRSSSGKVRKLIESDVVALHQIVAHSIQDVIGAIIAPALSLCYLFWVQWQMALATLVPLALALMLMPLMLRGGREKYQEYDRASADLAGATVEFVHGISVVKRFGEVGTSHRQYRERAQEYVKFVRAWSAETEKVYVAIEVVTSPLVNATWLLAAGLYLVSNGWAAPVDILPGLLLGLGLSAPLMRFGASSNVLRTAMKARESLQEFLDTPVLAQPPHPQHPAGSEVELAKVGFRYDDEHDVLRDVSAHCTPGTVTALVGASGSGKSTIAKLVARFYDVTAGAVELGGVDVRRMSTSDLYDEVGFVFQDVQLLRMSLRDNIRLVRPDASDEKVEAAARAAQIHDRILRFPRGYDSVVGEDANLSGGEAQRITIARSLLADSPVLVLDEATAFADPDSEAQIQRALSNLAAERTVLVVAHRLHTITGADQILVIDRGSVIERGTHEELVANDGRYAEMWRAYENNHARTIPKGVSA